MNSHSERLVNVSERWFRLLQRLYPQDFRDDMGDAVVDTYRDRARAALNRHGAARGNTHGVSVGGVLRLAVVWIRAFFDALRNGPGERVRPAVSWRRGGNWGRDAEVAFRRLRRAPLFVVFTASTLTLGLGVVGVVYTVVQKVLIEPMPYRDPGDLYYVWRDYGPTANIQRGQLAGTDIVELRKQNAVIEDVAAFQPFLGGTFSIREGSDPSEIAVTIATPNVFEMLGVKPVLGRGFARHEEGKGRPNTMILSHELWTRFGADPEIVGKDVRLQSREGNRFRVLGVLPPNFAFVRNDGRGVGQRIDAYISIYEDLAPTNPEAGRYSAIVRARRGASPEAVADAIGTIGQAIDVRDFNGRGVKLYPSGVKSDLLLRVRPALLMLAAAGILLVLMLTVNLASVLLARAAQREHEYAVSRALGANGAAIVRATLLEGALLGLIGSIAGTLVARWGTRALVAMSPLDLPRRDAITLDWRVAAVMIALGILLGVLAAIVPATWASRSSLSSLLASGNVRGGGGHGRMRRGLVVAQIALSLVLLSSGGLVVRSFERLLAADPGFDPANVLTFRVRSPPEFFPTQADTTRFQDAVEAALAAIPGVIGASATSSLPLTAAGAEVPITVPGALGNTGNAERDRLMVDQIATRATYPKVMGMRVIAGRGFDPVRREGFREALIDRKAAEHYFPNGANPIGAIIPRSFTRPVNGVPHTEHMPLTIVGVVDQARLYDMHQDGRPQLYVRTDDWGYRPLSFVVKTSRQPESFIQEARAAVRSVDARVAVGDVRTMQEIVTNVLRQQQTSVALIGGVALGALLLASMGLFGVVSGSVTRRRHELAVRLALGAEHGRVVRLVIGEGALLVALGVAIGVPGVYAAGGVLRGMLIDISPFDPATLAAVVAGLAAATLLACYLPARRVLGIDPAQALRNE